ncbi:MULTISPECIES: DUF6746 family protein [Halomonadaceae]|uniref:Uncharacterized protein n=2 Tax=Halomonadaceae TaxID=28256 RepID=A0ABS6ZUR2_9GAMM|nr:MULTISPECIES: DUF6746 family protein [Halomonas]MBW6392795.1 hypothetical protein [Halomonas antri]QTP57526.1 hypothetical protein HNO53_01565 [Halomonas sulfidivorans]
MKKLLLPTLLSGLMIAATAQASSPTEHFEGEPSETLSQAVANFSETNQQLAELLAQEELSMEDLGTIHELSYTLENALQKIDAEVETMAVNLEEVHLGSETGEFERVQNHGSDYLEAAQTLVP